MYALICVDDVPPLRVARFVARPARNCATVAATYDNQPSPRMNGDTSIDTSGSCRAIVTAAPSRPTDTTPNGASLLRRSSFDAMIVVALMIAGGTADHPNFPVIFTDRGYWYGNDRPDVGDRVIDV
jgi:hypothetical protein